MNLKEFEDSARAVWREIPDGYKEGVDGLVIEQNAHTHPDHEDFFTLGECVTEAYPSDFGGPETIRSAVVLYYGSFRAVAHNDPDFDWRGEIHETLIHELQHHLEQLADEDDLGDLDYAVEANYRRGEGEPFDPLFYRAGERIAEDAYRVEDDVFFELRKRGREAFDHVFSWEGREYRVAIPASDADVLMAILDVECANQRGELCVVRVLEKGALATLRAAFGGGHSVAEVVVPVQRS